MNCRATAIDTDNGVTRLVLEAIHDFMPRMESLLFDYCVVERA